jgi:hypothetical protein
MHVRSLDSVAEIVATSSLARRGLRRRRRAHLREAADQGRHVPEFSFVAEHDVAWTVVDTPSPKIA